MQEKIGEGTYGKVYKAKDLTTGKLVALKKTRLEVWHVSSRHQCSQRTVPGAAIQSVLSFGFADGGGGRAFHHPEGDLFASDAQ